MQWPSDKGVKETGQLAGLGLGDQGKDVVLISHNKMDKCKIINRHM